MLALGESEGLFLDRLLLSVCALLTGEKPEEENLM